MPIVGEANENEKQEIFCLGLSVSRLYVKYNDISYLDELFFYYFLLFYIVDPFGLKLSFQMLLSS